MPPSFPPIALSVEVRDANGTTTRWGSEDRYPENVPRNIAFSTQRMQGFGTGSVNLRRRIDRESIDVHLLDDVAFIGAGGDIAYEGRVGAMPRSFDTDHTLALQLAGHMALASDRTFTEIYVDRDLSAWTEPSRARKAALLASSAAIASFTVSPDPTDGLPGIVSIIADSWVAPFTPFVEGLYDAGPGNTISDIYVDYTNTNNAGNWRFFIGVQSDDKATASELGGDMAAGALTGTTRLTPVNRYRYGLFRHTFIATPGGAQGLRATFMLRNVAVYGNHGLTLTGIEPKGVSGSDVIRDIATRFCSGLSVTGVQDTGYTIPHLVFREQTTPYDAFLSVNAYTLWTLAVWEGKSLHYGPTDLTDYDWEIRTDDAGVAIDLQGDSTADLANGITVQFTNLETGLPDVLSPADYPELLDTAIDNPANLHGKQFWPLFPLSFPTTLEAALQIGRAALAEYNAPKAPGSITASHYVKDRAGHFQPAWKVRAGDRVAITSSTSLSDRPRMISETSYDHDSKTVTMSLEGPTKKLDAVIDRINTALKANNLS